MDSGAVDSPVTLVIKAPNQKYDDQTINCFLNWTVERLKSHIANVYPSKPSSKDQRLVYSGRLLQDHLQLRDVLRKQDEYHMMHLVCASRSPPGSPMPRSPSTAEPAASGSSSSSSDSAGSASPANTPNQDSQPAASSSSSVPGSYDGLRYRGGFPAAAVPQWPDGAQVPLQGGLPANVPPHPMYMPMQMLWWQQMYARHYYMQYQAAVAASQPPSAATPSPPSSSPSLRQPAQPNEAVQPPLGPNPAPNPVPENQPVNPNIQMNAQGGAVLNEDELNRDWLDWLYTVSRAGVLLSIVYFYSSFSRFVMVVGAMLLVYLHQAGWFPFRPEQQNHRGGEQGGAAQDEAERHQDLQEIERLMDEGMDDEDSGEEGGGGPEDQAQAVAALPQPGFLTSAWSFISTFFTSLIPEGRPHPAN
ncbi:homocysteine-responsive endoplasmic reticulum-resident ubiquitin-like domain member 2 protein isoform X2 [Myripristis murdjan]|uniref:homocysteine-responsive endoplasmic reticulum-resident ubiquitin-like domain member 2 protein isoform X2 n=1 Tax=Myripristis murdjan TaxID=586833 RepID=UPI001176481F|nr:homocysteine-responsive endoplasmic reticulum-resident ubiquitin-like domain member 2 protein isoform X2 [Myripristis murdjan]